MINNPFDITKAVDYTDAEIYKYWVDLDDKDNGFETLIKPNSLMPRIIVGSKGSGKTHLMKYFSYELQKIRCDANPHSSLQEGLARENFIGVYIRCSGFNSDKFSGKGVDNAKWALLHAYFWELWIGERLINILIDLRDNGSLIDFNEEEIVGDIIRMFTKPQENIRMLEDLIEYILSLQRNVDYQVQNFLFMGEDSPKVEILIPTAKLTYEIPALLRKKVRFFENKYILYLIDELENFSVEQQQLIQTLIREKPSACTFRIGTRPYGVRTLKTLGGVEENHDGAEFQGVILDEFLRNFNNYDKYVIKILENRLKYSGISLPKDTNLRDLFEEQDDTSVLNALSIKKDSQSRSYMKNLKINLSKLILDESQIERIIKNVSFQEDLLIERTSVMLLYMAFKDCGIGKLEEKSLEIAHSASEYVRSKSKDTLHHTRLEKYKRDIVHSLARGGRVDIPYNGLGRLIELSCGTPRTILCLLKAAFNNQYFNTGKIPFEDGRKLTTKSQKVGLESTYEWFFEENRIPSANQAKATDAVMRIGDYLRKVRFSDLPPQCSINIFTLNPSELSKSARDVFEALLGYSYIVQTEERRLINSDSKTHVYRLNSILLPKYELALGKRGSINLSAADAELFFNLEQNDKYEKYVDSKLKGYNFPFGKQGYKDQSRFSELDLFE